MEFNSCIKEEKAFIMETVEVNSLNKRSHELTNEIFAPVSIENASRLPIENASRLPIEGTLRLPIEGTSQLPMENASRLPIEGTLRLPIEGTSRLPIENASRLLIKNAKRLPIENASRLPIENASRLLIKIASRLLIEIASRQLIKMASRLLIEMASRLPIENASRLPIENASRLLIEITSRLFIEIASRVPIESTSRPPESSAHVRRHSPLRRHSRNYHISKPKILRKSIDNEEIENLLTKMKTLSVSRKRAYGTGNSNANHLSMAAESETTQRKKPCLVQLSCSEKNCDTVLTLEHVATNVMNLLSGIIAVKRQTASAEDEDNIQRRNVICPSCSSKALVDNLVLQFVCDTCNNSYCQYCMASFTSHRNHESCLLLSFAGKDCLHDTSKAPLNWRMNIPPFSKTFLQVDVPLNSYEGLVIARMFDKTTSGETRITKISRIHNLKIWEQYVMKRQQVESEVGTTNLAERFLFYGTTDKNAIHICGDGFDLRAHSGKNGGFSDKSVCFSVKAGRAVKYSDKSCAIFLARVICGMSQIDHFKRVKYENHENAWRLCDSWANRPVDPRKYIVFEKSQCYPEYLIKFENTDLSIRNQTENGLG